MSINVLAPSTHFQEANVPKVWLRLIPLIQPNFCDPNCNHINGVPLHDL